MGIRGEGRNAGVKTELEGSSIEPPQRIACWVMSVMRPVKAERRFSESPTTSLISTRSVLNMARAAERGDTKMRRWKKRGWIGQTAHGLRDHPVPSMLYTACLR